MAITRREFGNLLAASIPAIGGLVPRAFAFESQAGGKRIDSVIHGVQIGLQPFCYHDLPMTPANRHILIERMVQNGLGVVELHATWVEPRFLLPGVDPVLARQQQRAWRLATPPDFYRAVKKEFDDAGIQIFSYYVNAGTVSDEEVDALFEASRLLGGSSIVGSYGQAATRRLAAFVAKHPGMYLGIHNHDNLSDQDAYSNEESMEKGLAMSSDVRAWLDVRHFAAGNGDCVGFLTRHHERIAAVHLGDRRKNNGRSTPFGLGDAPIIEVLRTIRDNQYPIVALLEFEHGTLRSGVEETQLMFDYCKRALA